MDSNDTKPLPKVIKGQEIDSETLGLNVEVDPEGAYIDIVAVHGIGVNPRDTWTHRKTQVNWLSNEDMLPRDVPKARIMTFGYDSVWFGDNPTRQTIDGVARKLLEALTTKRDGDEDPQFLTRPIIFIGHGFGGLVLQQANIQVEEHNMTTMEHNNDTLVQLVSRFTRDLKIREPTLNVYCFFEEKKTNIGLIVGDPNATEFVVNETAGTLSGHKKQGLSLDHFNMNKSTGPKDYHYACVRDQIKKMVKDSQTVSWEKQSKNKPANISPHRPLALAAPGDKKQYTRFQNAQPDSYDMAHP
ncbi:hypothetical protein BX600DRAFT_442145 [Xylariales sp. PMI_506]|nr:hypothetical protein BX600DRAFT_442145 [Xylariales sp. PMI_506]